MKTYKIEIVANELPRVSDIVADQVEAIVRSAAFSVEAHAKAVVPVDTGALKNSIQTEFPDRFTAIIAPHTEYAVYVEYGTRFMSPRPYMRPAAERVRKPFLKALRRITAT